MNPRSLPFVLPPAWVEQVRTYPADGGPSGEDWLTTVPGLLAGALDDWELSVDGEPLTGWTAIVVPVRQGETPMALKATWPHPEGTREHLALRLWNGHGAVDLTAADPQRGLLLLERLDPTRDLRELTTEAGCAVAGALLKTLRVPAPEAFPGLTAYLIPHLEHMATRVAVPRRITERTRSLFADLSTGPQPTTLLHTDLHYENVLRGQGERREEWLAIDPKPLRGHPGFEILPLLWNRHEELHGRSFRTAMRRRLEITAEAADIDVDAAYAWSLVRAGVEVSWASTQSDPRETSTFIALTKALDD